MIHCARLRGWRLTIQGVSRRRRKAADPSVSSAGETTKVSSESRPKTRATTTNPIRRAPKDPIRSARETSSLARGRAFIRAVAITSRERQDIGPQGGEREPGIAAVDPILCQQERPHDERQRQWERESLDDIFKAKAASLRRG